VLALLVCGGSFLALSLGAAAGSGGLLRRLSGLAPWHRSWGLLVYALVPPALAVAITLVLFTPGLNGLAVTAHCHGLDCSGHIPMIETDARNAALAVTGVIVVPLIGIGAFGVAAVWRSTRLSSMLSMLAARAADRDYRVLESDRVMAVCVGVLRPIVVLSRGLIETSDASALEVVTLHERAHAVRYDNARSLLAQMATLVWPRRTRKSFLAALRLAAEESCDLVVAEAVRDRRRVADTIDALSSCCHGGAAAVCGDAAARVALLRNGVAPNAGPPGRVRAVAVAVALVLLAGTVLAAGAIHHGAERMLGG